MKTNILKVKSLSTMLLLFLSLSFINHSSAQQASFSLYPEANTDNYMKFRLKSHNVHGIPYTQGYVGIGKNKFNSGPLTPSQMLHISGGNILFTAAPGNPSCFNGAVLFGSEYDTTRSPAGEWGIEYFTDSDTIPNGLNFWKPYPCRTQNSGNFKLFLNDNGRVGIGTFKTDAKFNVEGSTFISDTLLVGNLNRNAPFYVFGSIGASTLKSGTIGLKKVVAADANGKLSLIENSQLGDNLGNHTAQQNIILGRYGLAKESPRPEDASLSLTDERGDVLIHRRLFAPNGIYGYDLRQGENFNKLWLAGSLESSAGYMELGDGSRDWSCIKMFGPTENGFLLFGTGERLEAKMLIKGSGVLVGTALSASSEPTRELDVHGSIALDGAIFGRPSSKGNNKLQLYGSSNNESGYVEIGDGSNDSWKCVKLIARGNNATLQFYAGNDWRMFIRSNDIIIGNANNKVDLKVNGKVFANEVHVSLDSWSDYVLSKSYELMPINQLSSYIEKNCHLPDIPSEKEIIEYGLNLGQMDALLLKKIEELTLYVIELKKENERQEHELEELRKLNLYE